MLAAVAFFAAMDTSLRYLGAAVPVLLLLIVRYLVQALLMAPVLMNVRAAARQRQSLSVVAADSTAD